MFEGWDEVFREVGQAVLPAIVVVIVLQFTVIMMPGYLVLQFLVGAFFVVVGLVLFLLGLKIGLLPMGEMIGSELPSLGSLPLILVLVFILSFAVTVAEPDVRVLTQQVDLVSAGAIGQYTLIAAVALGVGIFAALAMFRIIAGIPIAYLLAGGYLLILFLSFFVPKDFVAIAFDAGGVTTGPMAVPVIITLGLGMVSVMGGKSASVDGFGLVGLASLGPILGVMLLGAIYG